MACPYIIDLFTGGASSLWGNARAVNFILIPILLISSDFFSWLKTKNKVLTGALIVGAFVMTTKLSFYFFEQQNKNYQGNLSDIADSIQKEEVLVITNTLHKSSIFKILLALHEKQGELIILHTKPGPKSWSSLITSKLQDSKKKQLIIIEAKASVHYKFGSLLLVQEDPGVIRMPTGAYDHYDWGLYKYPRLPK